MIRYFCDRCNTECSQTGRVHISMPRFSRTPLLCTSCQTALENMVDEFLKIKYEEIKYEEKEVK